MSTTFQAGLFCGLAVILAMIGLKLAKVVVKIAMIAAAAVVLLLAADSAGWLPDGVVPDFSPASMGPGSDHALTEPVLQVNCASRSPIRARWEGLLRNPFLPDLRAPAVRHVLPFGGCAASRWPPGSAVTPTREG